MAEIQKKCKHCGTELSKDIKDGRCNECSATRRAKWKSLFKILREFVLPILALLGLAYLASRSSRADSDLALDEDTDGGDTEINVLETPTQASGEKYWNSRTQNWEKDGNSYTYRVTYKDARDGEIHTLDYSDVDNGYEDYEHYRKQWYTSQVEWDHVPPSEE